MNRSPTSQPTTKHAKTFHHHNCTPFTSNSKLSIPSPIPHPYPPKMPFLLLTPRPFNINNHPLNHQPNPNHNPSPPNPNPNSNPNYCAHRLSIPKTTNNLLPQHPSHPQTVRRRRRRKQTRLHLPLHLLPLYQPVHLSTQPSRFLHPRSRPSAHHREAKNRHGQAARRRAGPGDGGEAACEFGGWGDWDWDWG